MDIKEFLPEIRRMIQGPMQEVMADELYSSAIIFCKESKVLSESLPVGDVEPGTNFVVTPLTPNTSPWGVVSICSNNGELVKGVDYYQHSRDNITFKSTVQNVTVVAWLIPTSKTNIPQTLAGYSQEVAHGAASVLYLQPNKSWTDGSQADYHRRMFVEGQRKAYREMLEHFGSFQNPRSTNSYWI